MYDASGQRGRACPHTHVLVALQANLVQQRIAHLTSLLDERKRKPLPRSYVAAEFAFLGAAALDQLGQDTVMAGKGVCLVW